MNEADEKEVKLLDNKGMSLVELLIGAVILSLILSALFFFISVSTKAVKRSTDEAQLQLVSQTVTNQLQSAIMSAQDLAIQERLPADSIEEGFHTYLSCNGGLIDVKVLFIDKTMFVFNHADGIIYFNETSGIPSESISDTELAGIMVDENILSKQVKEFKVSLSTLELGYVELYLLFEKGIKTIESNNKIQVRNYK